MATVTPLPEPLLQLAGVAHEHTFFVSHVIAVLDAIDAGGLLSNVPEGRNVEHNAACYLLDMVRAEASAIRERPFGTDFGFELERALTVRDATVPAG